MASAQISTHQRFERLVQPDLNSGCWLWSGSVTRKGYGRFGWCGRTGSAHRYAYLAHYGTLPSDLFVCHRCDTPACVNPAHLFLGTAKENNAGTWRRGRRIGQVPFGGPQGTSRFTADGFHPRRKLTDSDVQEVRRLWSSRSATQGELAKQYGVRKDHIKAICGRRRRGAVPA